MITVELRKQTAVFENIANADKGIRTSVKSRVLALAIMLSGYIKTNKLSGQVLNAVSGKLRRSINFTQPYETATAIQAKVYSDSTVKYGAIHEYGGRTSPHDIFPKRGGVLAFTMGGKQVFASVVHHPGSIMPERSFMRTALADKERVIRTELQQAVVQGAVGK